MRAGMCLETSHPWNPFMCARAAIPAASSNRRT
jgi:hypothetical protein